MKSLKTTTVLIIALSWMGCNKPPDAKDFVETNLTKANNQTHLLLKEAVQANQLPRTVENGEIKYSNPNFDWCEGFFPGLCWYLYENDTTNVQWKEGAEKLQATFQDHRFLPYYHDLGFVFWCSYGNGYRLTGNEAYKQILIDAGNTLISRYSPNVGCIKSWDTDKGWQSKRGWQYPVIIDNMMNLELLFELTRMTGDSTYHKIAEQHALHTMKNHFREDMSCYHVIDYDSITGEIRNKHTAQGFAHESSWARGQAWAVYGFTMSYRYTQRPEFLAQAEKIAAFLINNQAIPQDRVPYWDYNAPDIPKAPRDASAAAITASALIELSAYTKQNVMDEAMKIMNSLASEYQAKQGENNFYILEHSVGSVPHRSEIDAPIIYADYYYVEALVRLKQKQVDGVMTAQSCAHCVK